MSHFKKRAVLEDEDGEERSGKNEKKRRVNIAEVGCPPSPPASCGSLTRAPWRQEEDDSEEGEVMDQAPKQDEDYDSIDDYDEEGYKDAEDRIKLSKMSMLEHERILSDRHERRERRKETLEVATRL